MHAKAPSHTQLVETYPQVRFPGVCAAVFFDPLGDGSNPKNIAELTGEGDVPGLINADIYVWPLPEVELVRTVDRLDEDIYGFVAAWDGQGFVTENT